MSWDKPTLQEEVRILIKETEDYADALHYVDEVAEDLKITRDEVIEELKRQLGKSSGE
jgi:spore coat polysaccharide biosynthesis protein SpsF (cytidylyltransferase family)